jgi:hypothetical protein
MDLSPTIHVKTTSALISRTLVVFTFKEKKMKHVYALVLLVSPLFMSLQGQYYPMVSEDFTWNMTSSGIISFSSTQYFEGDSVVDGVTYNKFISILDLAPNSPVLDALIREDETTQMVYAYFNGAEQLLYDFDVVPGDVVATTVFGCETSVTVESVGTISIAGTDRDLITMTSGEYWIEGIGSVNSVLGPNYIDCLPDWSPALTCFSNMDVAEWTHPDSGTCVIATSVDEQVTAISVYPNPASDYFTVAGGAGERFSVFNAAGQILFGGLLQGTVTLQTGMLAPGIYIIKIEGRPSPIQFCKI